MPISAESGWVRSAEGRPVDLLSSHSLTDPDFKNPILLMGGVHGDEPEGVFLAEGLLRWLISAPPAERGRWLLIPCLNPDGFSAQTRVNGRGVDLNRNYPSRDWSGQSDAPRYFPGLRPASEPEVQGVVGLIENYQPRLIIHFHSWNPCVVVTGAAGRPAAEALAAAAGYRCIDDIGYPTPGSLSRFAGHDRGIPVICIEEAERTGAQETWDRFAPAFKKILGRGELV